MSHLQELTEERAQIVQQARELVERAEGEKRDFHADETEQYDRLMDKADELRGRIERQRRQDELDREAAEADLRRQNDDPNGGENRGGKPSREELEVRGLRAWLLGHSTGEGLEEFRNLQADADTSGGFLVVPQLFATELIKAVDDLVFIRQRARVLPPLLAAASLGAPSLDADPADADWTTELATGSEDSTMAFGKRELNPHPLAKRIKVSNKLLRIGSLQPETLVRDRLAYKFAITQEKAYLTGSGAQQPLGLFTASSNGISTSRDISSGNTTSSIQTDGLLEAKYAVKAQYMMRGEWLFHRDGVKQIAKLKDGDGQYLWRQSVIAGEPDLLLGRPVMMSEYAPNTFTSGLYVGLFGDFRNYWIVDSLALTIQRLIELYAETNEVGFIGRYEGDGMPVLEEAFARVTLG